MKKRGNKVGSKGRVCWCCCCRQEGNARYHNRLRKQQRVALAEVAREAGVPAIRLRSKAF